MLSDTFVLDLNYLSLSFIEKRLQPTWAITTSIYYIGLHMGPNNLCYVTRHFLFFTYVPSHLSKILTSLSTVFIKGHVGFLQLFLSGRVALRFLPMWSPLHDLSKILMVLTGSNLTSALHIGFDCLANAPFSSEKKKGF